MASRGLLCSGILAFGLLLASGKVHVSCPAHGIHCLFSRGAEETAESVDEAQDLCSTTRPGSRPLELTDERMLFALEEFIRNCSLPDDPRVILNARVTGSRWEWARDAKEIVGKVRKVVRRKEGQLYYQRREVKAVEPSIKFHVVCLTDCHSNRETIESKAIDGGTKDIGCDFSGCEEECEFTECEGWQCGAEKDGKRTCWLQGTIGDKKLVDDVESQIFRLDRNSKTVENCVGQFAAFRQLDENDSAREEIFEDDDDQLGAYYPNEQEKRVIRVLGIDYKIIISWLLILAVVCSLILLTWSKGVHPLLMKKFVGKVDIPTSDAEPL